MIVTTDVKHRDTHGGPQPMSESKTSMTAPDALDATTGKTIRTPATPPASAERCSYAGAEGVQCHRDETGHWHTFNRFAPKDPDPGPPLRGGPLPSREQMRVIHAAETYVKHRESVGHEGNDGCWRELEEAVKDGQRKRRARAGARAQR